MMNRDDRPGRWRVSVWRKVGGGVASLGLLSSSLVGVVSLPTPALSQSVPTTVREGYTLLNQGRVNQAIAVFERTIQRYPQSLEARLGLAIAYRRAGRDADAFRAYEQVLTVDPTNRLALVSLGLLGGFRPEWQQRGIEALTTLLQVDPTDVEARTQRALLYNYQGQFGNAIADYEQVLQSNPVPAAVIGAAEVYAYLGNYDQSLALFQRYQQSGETIEGTPAIAYALALRETGNPQAAVQVLEAQLQQQPEINGTTIRMRAELAIDYAAIGQVEAANAVLTPLRGRQDSRMILARSLISIGRYTANPTFLSEGVALFQNVLTTAPQFLTVGIGREIADVLTGFPQERTYALEIYRQLVQQQPNDRSLQIQLAVLEYDLGQLGQAELQQRLEQALQPLPSDPVQLEVIAQSLARLDNPDPTLLPFYTRLLQAGADEPLLSYRIAQIQIQQGDYAAAQNAIAAYLATPTGQRNAGAATLLVAEIARQQGNLEGAAQQYEAVIASNPSDIGVLTGALQGLAGIRQSQGRLPEAIALYDQIIALNPQDSAKVLAQTSLAYQAGLITDAQAEAVLANWLASQPQTYTPPELFSLVAALPASAQRQPLYEALLRVNPDSIPVQLRYVEAIAAQDPAAADAYVRQLIANDPDNLNLYLVQGQVAQQTGDLSGAVAAYEALLSRDPRNVDALSSLGGVRFQQRRYDTASRLYSEVLTLNPNNPQARTALIDLEVVQGRRLNALEQLEQLQLQHMATTGQPNAALSRQQQGIEEGFLQQRGFELPWERF